VNIRGEKNRTQKMDNLKQLANLKGLHDVKRVELTERIKGFLGPASKRAETNEKNIYCYSFFYTSNNKKIRGYIVEPREGNNLPCIIWNRGGWDDFGSIKIGMLFAFSMARFARSGYVVIATQYPGVGGGEGKDEMGGEADVQAVLDLKELLSEYTRSDQTRIGMYGHSRGGMMTYMCMARANWIKAAVVGAAKADEVNAHLYRKNWKDNQKKMYGGSEKEKIKRSAIMWPEKMCKTTPLLICHGTADWRVNPQESLILSQKLLALKHPVRTIMYEGADHGISEFGNEYIGEAIKWFDRFVKNHETLPNMELHGR
jgi:dipeptidyl aminopeptidase/acylaminoacyl peptidase